MESLPDFPCDREDKIQVVGIEETATQFDMEGQTAVAVTTRLDACGDCPGSNRPEVSRVYYVPEEDSYYARGLTTEELASNAGRMNHGSNCSLRMLRLRTP